MATILSEYCLQIACVLGECVDVAVVVDAAAAATFLGVDVMQSQPPVASIDES